MHILSAHQVKTKLKEDRDIQLIMTLHPTAFRKCHIPGSINIWNIEKAVASLSRHAEIIVYCSDLHCRSSYLAYQQLEQKGFTNIWRFAGGLVEWEAAGYPLNCEK